MKSNSLFSSKAIRRILRIAFCVGCLLTIVSTTSAQTTIFSETFEGSFPNTWYIGNDGGLGGYTWGDNSYWAYAGSWSGFCCDSSNGSLNGANTYKNDRHTYMEKRGVSFVSFTSCSLKFRLKRNTEYNYDFFTVNVRNQAGTWSQVYSRSGSNPAWPNWDDVQLNLSSFAGQTGLYIQFRFDSDLSGVPSAPAGVWVDEIYCIGRTNANADLAMSNLSFSPTPIYVGANPTAVSFRVTNNGPANMVSPNTRVRVDFYLSTNTTWSTGDTKFGDNGYDFTLNSGSYTDVTLSPTGLSYLTIPATQTPGTYYVFAKIQHTAPSALVDPTSTNDYTMRVGAITVIANADLAMSNLLFSPTPIQQGAHPTAVSFRVTNNGPANMVSPNTRVRVDFYLSTNTTWSTGDTKFGDNGYDFTLNSGSYTDVTLSPTGLSYLTIPATQTPGTYYVFAKIQHTAPSYLVDPTSTNDYTMRVGIIDVILGVEGAPDPIITPKVFALTGICPNPSKGYAELKYQLPQQENVTLKVYDLSGRVVRSLNVGNKNAGYHSYSLQLQNLPAGNYLCKITAGSYSATKTILIVK